MTNDDTGPMSRASPRPQVGPSTSSKSAMAAGNVGALMATAGKSRARAPSLIASCSTAGKRPRGSTTNSAAHMTFANA